MNILNHLWEQESFSLKASKNGFKAFRDPKLREVGAEHMKQQ